MSAQYPHRHIFSIESFILSSSPSMIVIPQILKGKDEDVSTSNLHRSLLRIYFLEINATKKTAKNILPRFAPYFLSSSRL